MSTTLENTKRLFTLLLIIGLSLPASHADESSYAWEEEKTTYSKDTNLPIHLFTQIVPGQPIKRFKGISTIPANTTSILAAIFDVDAISELVFNAKLAKEIKGTDDNSYVYTQIKGIWPVSDRDSVIKSIIHQNPKTKEIIIKSTSKDNVYTPVDGHIRLKDVETFWSILPLPNGYSRVTFFGHADPAGRVPKWLANMVVTKMPNITLKNLHTMVQKQKYKNTKLQSINTGPTGFDITTLDLPAIHRQ